MDKNTNFKSVILFIVLPYLGIVVIHLLLALQLSVPTIWPDEFINYFKAKYIIEGSIPTKVIIPINDLVGTFGYSLIISPLFAIFREPQTVFQSILIFNSIIGSSIYIAIFLFIKILFQTDNKKPLLISIIVSLYPAYILQGNNIYSDAVAPAIFLFSILAFYYLLKKQNVFSSVIFVLITTLLVWFNIRLIPFPIISLLFLVYLVLKKQFKTSQLLLLTVLFILLVTFGIYLGDLITCGITGAKSPELTNFTVLLNISQMTLLFVFIYLIIYFFFSKRFIFSYFSLIGLTAGILSNNHIFYFAIIPIAFLISLLVNFHKPKSTQYIGLVYSIMIALIIYIIFPSFVGFSDIIAKLLAWIINLSGSVYYALISTFLLFFTGLIFTIIQLYNNSVNRPDEKEMEISLEKEFKKTYTLKRIIYEPRLSLLLFMFLVSLACFFVSIYPNSYEFNFYRADLLFYGRNIELIIAGILAIALYKLKESDPKDYVIAIISTIIFFSFFSILLIISYNNLIESEASFKSIISFFPLRAIIGNINIIIFSTFTFLIGLFFILFHRYKPVLTTIIISSIFLFIIFFTFNYVDLYNNNDKLNRTKIVDYLNKYFTDIDNINYDRSLYKESSQNGLSYAFHLSGRKINFIDSSQFNSGLIISTSSFGLQDLNKYALLAIEHDGNDYLWADRTKINNQKIANLIPSYLDIPLTENWVGGVAKINFYKDNWINNDSKIIFPIRTQDSSLTFSFVIYSTYTEKNFLNLNMNHVVDTAFQMNPGLNTVNLKLNNTSVSNHYTVELFSSLYIDEKNEKCYGLQLKSLIIKNNSKNNVLEPNLFISNSYKDLQKLILELRQNIDLSLLKPTCNDSITLPIRIVNNSDSVILLNKDSVKVGYIWKDFVFKGNHEQKLFSLKGNIYIKPNSDYEQFITIYFPKEKKKFFLEFGLFDLKNKKLELDKNRYFLFNFKQEK